MKHTFKNTQQPLIWNGFMTANNPRQTYLQKTLGLSHDPFAGPVAEQELHSSEKEPRFFSYYTDPKDPKFNKPLPQVLREAHNGLIFGRPGSGKTTLRFTLEAECRSVYDRTLVVTYELSHKITQPPAAEKHWAKIAEELAIDLFIQVIELLDALDAPTDIQKQHLRTQMALIWPRLRRTADLILEDDFSDRENGLAALWPRLNRPAVRYINQSPKIRDLVKECLPPPPQTSDLPLSSEVLLKAGIAAAKAWGFKQIFVLGDGVDAYERQVADMLALISPLLSNLTKWQAEGLFFYFFLPSEMRLPLTKTYREALNNLPFPPIYYIIEWVTTNLAEILHQRLRAAGSRILDFDALAADFENNLEDYLVKAAQNSPRRLLRLVSALIDAHAQAEPEQLLISTKDWYRMRQNWGYGLPLPPNLK